MSDAAALRFQTEDDVIARIALLRRGYVKKGNWTLAQICWHVGLPIRTHLKPPEPMDLQRTPEQEERKVRFVDYIVAHRKAPEYAKTAPPSFVPPETAGEAEIEEYIAALRTLKAYPHPKVLMGPVGPVTIEEFRTCNLVHAEHHFGFLEPAGKRSLRFKSYDDIRDEVKKLRAGKYSRIGNWSLEQVCDHLAKAFKRQMSMPPAAATEDQQKARPVFEKVLSSGEIPQGIQAPDFLTPPPSADAAAIDDLLATLDQVEKHNAPVTMHRIFGPMKPDEFRKLGLAHCGHHLSHLIPTT